MKIKGEIKKIKSEKGLFSPRPYIYIILILFFNISLNLSLFGATLTVCSSGCDYTTIQTAYNAATAGDTIELHESISQNLYMNNAKACNITSASGQMYTWDGADSGTATLIIESSSAYNAWTISNIIMDHSSSSGGNVVEIYRGGNGDNNPNVTFDQCVLQRTSTSTTNNWVIQGTGGSWDGSPSSQITMTRTEIIGNAYSNGLRYDGGNNTHAYDLTNCILRGFTAGYAIYDAGNNYGLNIVAMNCTFFNNSVAYRSSGSANRQTGRYITNSLFLSNTTNIENMNSNLRQDITYCAIDSGATYGTGCQYDPTTAEVIDATAGSPDLHLSSTAPLCLDNGTNTGAPSDDFDGVARPYNTTTDIGAYEWSVAIAMTKIANTYIATIGDTVTFCITYTNQMGSTQTFKVWDTLPAEMTYLGCDSCSRDFFGDTQVIWWQINSLADGGSGTVCFWATVTSLPHYDFKKEYFSYWEKWNTISRLYIDRVVFETIENSREGV